MDIFTPWYNWAVFTGWTPGSVWVFWSRGGRDPVPSVLEWNFSLWSKLLSPPAWVQLTELIRESGEERKETTLINNQCSRHHLALRSEDKWMQSAYQNAGYPLKLKTHTQPLIIQVFGYLTKSSPQPITLHESLAQLSRNDPTCFLSIMAPSSLPTLFAPDSLSSCYSARGSGFIISSGLCPRNPLAWQSHFHSRAQWSEGKHSKTCVYLCVSWINKKNFSKI